MMNHKHPVDRQKMTVNPIFNPGGNDDTEHRTIWFGETTNLMQLNDGATRLT